MTHPPHDYTANDRLRGEPITLMGLDGRYLSDAQEFGGALYTIFGHRFPDATIARMRPDDAAKAGAATQPWG